MFGLSGISDYFSLGRVRFDSGRFRVNQFLVKCARHAKTSNFVENFGSCTIRLGSIRISGLSSDKHISDVGSDMSPGRPARVSDLSRVSDLGSVLLGLHPTHGIVKWSR